MLLWGERPAWTLILHFAFWFSLSFSHPVIIYMLSRYQFTVTTIYQVLAGLPPGSADRVSLSSLLQGLSSVCSRLLSPSL